METVNRIGHDRRYALTSAKLKAETGWTPEIEFDQGLAQTIDWYRANTEWVEHVRSAPTAIITKQTTPAANSNSTASNGPDQTLGPI